MLFFLLEFYWVVLIGTFILAMSVFDKRMYGFTGIIELLMLAFGAFVLNKTVDGGLMSLLNPNAVVTFSVGYIVAGVVTAFIYYIVFCWHAKETYTNYLEEYVTPERTEKLTQQMFDAATKAGEPLPTLENIKLRAKYNMVYNNIDSILDADWARNRLQNDMRVRDFPSDAELEAALKTVLPPKFKHHKKMLIWSAVTWPITLAWLLLFRFIRQIIERLMTWGRAFFDYFGSMAFGKL